MAMQWRCHNYEMTMEWVIFVFFGRFSSSTMPVFRILGSEFNIMSKTLNIGSRKLS